MLISAAQYDAFTVTPGKGDPAGVVLDADALTEVQMQDIARQAGFNETVFALRSDTADVRLRFFTPGHEVDLCGHGTVGTLVALHRQSGLPVRDYTIETNAGLLPVRLYQAGESVWVEMAQPPARFVPFEGDPDALAAAIGLTRADFAADLPLVYGNTGLWTLIVPVNGLDAMRRMRSDNARFPEILTQMPRVSVHPLCLDTIDPAADLHGRHFSSPHSGTVEDSVTGTASGVMGAYHAKYIARRDGIFNLLVEQGHEIGRDGRVQVAVEASNGGYRVRIAGTAVFAREMDVDVYI